MKDTPVILVKEGRHPLQELVVDQFVPNDTAIGNAGQNCAIVTGPNFSGKSVYLKQVGIIVFLAQVSATLDLVASANRPPRGRLNSSLALARSPPSFPLSSSSPLTPCSSLSNPRPPLVLALFASPSF